MSPPCVQGSAEASEAQHGLEPQKGMAATLSSMPQHQHESRSFVAVEMTHSRDLECIQAFLTQPGKLPAGDARSASTSMLGFPPPGRLNYLTPPELRKGKGGRQPALDPRLDPNVDPKRAKRILANRLSAARSKMKQKSHVDVSGPPKTCAACPLPMCITTFDMSVPRGPFKMS